jgi:hypothetical protein
MKRIAKGIATILTGVIAFQSVCFTPAHASSRVTYSLDGRRCYGTIEYVSAPSGTCNGVRAQTSFSGEGATRIWVRATLYFAGKGNMDTDERENVGSYGASATVRLTKAGIVQGGKGEHSVTYKNATWGPEETSIGNTKK